MSIANSERIVQFLYRRLKGLSLTSEENQELDTWLARSEANRKVKDTLSDENWLKDARKRYYAPGKEAGLAQLRTKLFTDVEKVNDDSGKIWQRLVKLTGADQYMKSGRGALLVRGWVQILIFLGTVVFIIFLLFTFF